MELTGSIIDHGAEKIFVRNVETTLVATDGDSEEMPEVQLPIAKDGAIVEKIF